MLGWGAAWPDVWIKRSPNGSISCPKSSQSSLYFKVVFPQNSPKGHKILRVLLMKSYHLELSKSPNLVTLVRRKLTSQGGYGAVYRCSKSSAKTTRLSRRPCFAAKLIQKVFLSSVQCDQFWRNFTTLARRWKTLAILKGFINWLANFWDHLDKFYIQLGKFSLQLMVLKLSK